MATEVKQYPLVVDTERMIAESFFPGIAYDDFDRGGGVSPWKVCRMFEAGRAIPFVLGNFLDFNKLTSNNHGFFVLGGDYYFDPCLWEETRKYHYFPYKTSLEILAVGRTSLTIRQVLHNTLDDREVATFYGKLVYVDKTARKAVPLPDWIAAKFKAVTSRKGYHMSSPAVFVGAQKVEPADAFVAETLVAASDTDHNGHTNQASYIRFCLDAAEAARLANRLPCVSRDVCQEPILKMSVCYRGETHTGQRLLTSVWHDDLSPPTLHFAMRRGDRVVFTAMVTLKQKAQGSKL